MKNAAAYVRVSTDDQMEFSPESQLRLICDYAQKNGFCLSDRNIYMEQAGISGKSAEKRPRFLEMLSASKRKPAPFEAILVWKFSRFARNMEEAITLKSMLKKNGVEVISISEPIPDGPFGDLIARVIEWSDAYYLVNLSGEVRRGMQERVSRGLPVTPPPVGYSMVNGRYEPDASAAFIKGIFSDFVNGVDLRALALRYADLGLLSKRGNPPDTRMIAYILQNPVYIGKLRWSRPIEKSGEKKREALIYNGVHPPLIDPEIFRRAQLLFKDRKTRCAALGAPGIHPLKGLVYCSACGAVMVHVAGKTEAFQCRNYARGLCRVSHYVAYRAVWDSLLNVLDFCLRDSVIEIARPFSDSHKNQLTQLNACVKAQNRQLERIKRAYVCGVDSLEEYETQKSRITKQLSALHSQCRALSQIGETQEKSIRLPVMKTLRDPAVSNELKFTLLQSFIRKIIFQKKEYKLIVCLR